MQQDAIAGTALRATRRNGRIMPQPDDDAGSVAKKGRLKALVTALPYSRCPAVVEQRVDAIK